MPKGRDQNEEMIKFLQELRVMLPGVQVLFAFLLTVPFSQQFEKVTASQRGVYTAALLFAAFATIFIIAPSVNHRLRWHEGASEDVMSAGNRLVVVGTIFLAGSVGSSVFLIVDFIYQTTTASLIAGAVMAAMLWFWWGMPLVQRARDGRGG